MLLLFFFFKQKTAYEMRISDWSSDVCSSDLAVEHRGGDARLVFQMLGHRAALVAPARQHHRRPEGDEFFEMRGPVVDRFVEQGADLGIGVHPVVKGRNQAPQRR